MFPYANEKLLVSILVAIGAISAGISLLLSNQNAPIPWHSFGLWLKIAGAGGTPAAVVLLVFEKWAWRWQIIYGSED